MTADEIALVKQLRTRARVYEMVGDTTPSVLMSRAANAMEAIGPAERARIVAALRKWAACMRGEEGPLDDDNLREAWKNEIAAADSFASQIESGAL